MGAHRLSAPDVGEGKGAKEPAVLGIADAAESAGALDILTDQALFEAVGVRIGFAGRAGGVSQGPYASLDCALHVGDDEAAVRTNRRLLFEALGAGGARAIIPTQVHGTNVLVVRPGDDFNAAQEEALKGADALVVSAPEVGALLNFADCLPLVIVSPSGAFGVAHAGWRGAVAHIAAKTARALSALDGCDPAQFNAYIGAHIRSECFEVGEEVIERFRTEFGEVAIADARHVSLAVAVTADLLEAGLDARRIADAGICTVCHSDRYFSYRASGGTCGRHAVVALRMS